MLTEYDQIVGDQTGFSYESLREEYRAALVLIYTTCIAHILGIAKTDYLPRLRNT